MFFRRVFGALALTLMIASMPVAAQRGQGPPPNAKLIRQIDMAFSTRVKRELALSPDQGKRFDAVRNRISDRRARLEVEGRQLHMNLDNLMASGTPKPLRVNQLLDRINANEMAYEQTFADEMQSLTNVFTPVQRVNYQRMRDQLQQSVRRVMQEGRGGGPPAQLPPGRGLRGGRGGGIP